MTPAAVAPAVVVTEKKENFWARLAMIAGALVAIAGLPPAVAKTVELVKGKPQAPPETAQLVRWMNFLDDTDSAHWRHDTLMLVAEALNDDARLVELGKRRLAIFVVRETRRTDADPCATPVTTRADVALALEILLRPRPNARTVSETLSLDRANLGGLEGRNRDFRGISLIGACLEGAQLPGATFRKVNLSGARMDRANLDSANLDSAIFRGAYLRRAVVERATGDAPNFAEARLQGASFNGAVLSRADLVGARLECTTFQDAKLRGADFRDARISWAFFDRTELTAVRDWRLIRNGGAGGAFVQTAVLDNSLKQWAHENGADNTAGDPMMWTLEVNQRWQPGQFCDRIVTEP